MRVSAIADWTTCEAMALTDPRPEARVHVAAWVGTLAHAQLLGGPLPAPPARLRFDALTPTAHAATVQANSIMAAAMHLLMNTGWAIMEAEREVTGNGDTGHLDILGWHGETKRTAIIDLKTGQGIGAGWLQVGGYLSLWAYRAMNAAVEGNATPYFVDKVVGGILHAPRVAVSKEPHATLVIRDGGALVRAWTAARDRIDAVLAGATALRSPGNHCGRCSANCPVRIGEH